MQDTLDKDLERFVKIIKPKSLSRKVESCLIAFKIMGIDVTSRVGTWIDNKETKNKIEYAAHFNTNEYRHEYVRNKISFVFHQNDFEMFVVRLQSNLVDVDKLNQLIEANDETSVLYHKGTEFILNCTNIKLVGDIVTNLFRCMK
jgi:hypothetical protein